MAWKQQLKENAIAIASGAFAVGLLGSSFSLVSTFDTYVKYCDARTNPCTQIEVPVWLQQPPEGAKFVQVEEGYGAFRTFAGIGGTVSFFAAFIGFSVASDTQRQIDDQKHKEQWTESERQRIIAEEEIQKLALAASMRLTEFKRNLFDGYNQLFLETHPEIAEEILKKPDPKMVEQVEGGEEVVEAEPIGEENEESSKPSQGKEILKILRTHIQELTTARLKLVKNWEGAAFNRYLFKGQTGTKWISALDDKAAELLQVELELDCPPIIQTVAGGVAVDIPRSDRKVFDYADYTNQLSRKPSLPIGIDLEGTLIQIPLDSVQGSNVLAGGTTRSGKSNWQTGALTSLVDRFDPGTVMLLVIDGKRTEFTWLDGCNHLLLDIAREPEDALTLLELTYKEMGLRQHHFGEIGARNLAEYNTKSHDLQDKPILCLFADEIGNVINALDEEDSERARELLNQLSSQGIAAGIFLILATQKPVADDLPSKTKSNCGTRICFKVEGSRDSLTVMNQKGGENLLGAGDLLATSSQFPGTLRLQALFLKEVKSGNFVEPEVEPKTDVTRNTGNTELKPTKQMPEQNSKVIRFPKTPEVTKEESSLSKSEKKITI